MFFLLSVGDIQSSDCPMYEQYASVGFKPIFSMNFYQHSYLTLTSHCSYFINIITVTSFIYNNIKDTKIISGITDKLSSLGSTFSYTYLNNVQSISCVYASHIKTGRSRYSLLPWYWGTS